MHLRSHPVWSCLQHHQSCVPLSLSAALPKSVPSLPPQRSTSTCTTAWPRPSTPTSRPPSDGERSPFPSTLQCGSCLLEIWGRAPEARDGWRSNSKKADFKTAWVQLGMSKRYAAFFRRRYADVMVHRLLAAVLQLEPLPETARDRWEGFLGLLGALACPTSPCASLRRCWVLPENVECGSSSLHARALHT